MGYTGCATIEDMRTKPLFVQITQSESPERVNDVAWESDRIAHRMYQLDLIKTEGTISSGVDVWCKRTRDLVVDTFYRNGDYHNDHGIGLDDYHVSRKPGLRGPGDLGRGEAPRVQQLPGCADHHDGPDPLRVRADL